MTLSPDEIHDALSQEKDLRTHRTSPGTQLTSVLLAGLGWLPALAGAMVRHHDARRGWALWLGLLLSAAVVASSALVSGRDRRHDRTFATFWLSCAALGLLVAVVELVVVLTGHGIGHGLLLCLLMAIVPVVCCLGLLVTTRARR